MIMKKILLFFFTTLNIYLFAQEVTHYSNNFETGTLMTYNQTSVNTWRVADCAGNGATATGSNALYVSKGGSNPGCGTDGQDQYAFAAAPPSSTERMSATVAINGKCTNSHIVSFDYKLNPNHASNQGFVIYSLDGNFWFVQDTLPSAANWTSYSVQLNHPTNNTDFFVGVRFEYSNLNGDGSPLAIDNFAVKGQASVANILEDTLAVCGVTAYYPVEAVGFYNGTGTWSVVSGSGTFNNPSANPNGINNLQFGTSVLAWTVVSADCGNSSDTVVLVNSLAPSNANVQDTFYACSIDPLNISTSAPMAGTGMWSSPQGAIFSDPMSPATTVTTLPSGWTELIWTISSPGCPSKADTMNVFKTGGQKILTADTTFCYDTNPVITIHASTIDSLQTLTWIFASGNGVIDNPDSSTIQVSGLQMGENILIYTVDHTLCPTEVDSIRIAVTPCSDFEPIFPTLITPNGDGKNDLFVVHNLEKIYPSCQMTIFNRWGSVVFESTGYAMPWDGTFKGEKLPMGAYFFKLELNDGNNTIYNGPISIIH
jgi:gliding motility-associated-like protein